MRPFLTLSLVGALAACGSPQDTDSETSSSATKPVEATPPVAETVAPAPEPTPAPEATPPVEPAPPAAPAMTDPEIAAFLGNAHKGEIELGNLAIKTTKNKDVKALAQMIVKDHTAADKKSKDMLGKAGIAPQEGEQARMLAQGAQDTMTKLKELKGVEFDKAYVDSQVEMHQKVIDAVDQTLMPAAQNAELKQLMTDARPGLEKHLEHCKKVQAALAAK